MIRKNWTVIVPCVIGFILSITAIWLFGFERIDFGDAADYINSANSLLNGTAYPRRGDFHPIFRAPVFPAFIAFVWTFFPGSVVAFKIQIRFAGIGRGIFAADRIN